jgi:hypothetical protein
MGDLCRGRPAAVKTAAALTAALLLHAAPGLAQQRPCRINFGGVYDFPHSGIKPDGNFFSALVTFNFRNDGTFDVKGTINERGKAPFEIKTLDRPWAWTGACEIMIDRPAFVGRVSDDGRFLSLATFDDEQLAGIAIRRSANAARAPQ